VLPPFGAGSHIDVYIREGLVRQYSLCNDPRETQHYLIAVRRDSKSRGGARVMHDEVREGDVIEISEPKNHFPLVHSARRSLLLAGGIGVTPILCMAEYLADIGADFEMHYRGRSRRCMAFVDRIARSAYADRASLHFSDGAPEQLLDIPALLSCPDPQTHLYLCGPTGFMDVVIDVAKQQGWPDANVHKEYFAAEMRKSDNGVDSNVKISSSGKI
jgi:vanillate O-demethylase ferredoxin subunit